MTGRGIEKNENDITFGMLKVLTEAETCIQLGVFISLPMEMGEKKFIFLTREGYKTTCI